MKSILTIVCAISLCALSCSEQENAISSAAPATPRQGVEQQPDPKKLAEAEKTNVKQDKVSIDIDKYEFQEMADAGNVTILDVRTPAEFADGHVDGAINVDYQADGFDTAVQQLDTTVPVLLYCQSGGRSSQAKKVLENAGFVAIYHLSSGYKSL